MIEQLPGSFVVSFVGSGRKYLYLLPDSLVLHIINGKTLEVLNRHCFARELQSHKLAYFDAQKCGSVVAQTDGSLQFQVKRPRQ